MCVSVHAISQIKIAGTVADSRGGVIAGANIFLKDTYDGTSSDENGSYEFVTTGKGDATLIVTFVGYKPFEKRVFIGDNDLEIVVVLIEQINELQAVTINAGSFTASDASRRTVFRALDIATTAGATADIAGALNTLPGTQKVGESGRLFVRGGDGNETRTFIDGMVVLDAYGPAAPNTPSRGRFLPFMFKGTSFSTGGYSAEYGQALSSALVLDSKDKSEVTRTDLSILSVGADAGHTHVWKRSSIGTKFEYTNLKPYVGLVKQEIDWQDAPASFEGSGAYRHQVGKEGLLKVYFNSNSSRFSFLQGGQLAELYKLKNKYHYLNTHYQDVLGENWSIRGGISYTYSHDDTRISSYRDEKQQDALHIKSVVEGSLADNLELKIGAEVIDRAYDQREASSDGQRLYRIDENISALFAEADVYASNRFVTRVGARMEYNNMIEQVSLDPRVSLAYKIGNNGQVSLAYGKFRQSAGNEFLKLETALKPEKADHYIVNYQYKSGDKIFRAEGYYKKYNDLVKAEEKSSSFNNRGYGNAKGIELFWRDNSSFRGLDYWVSYSFLDTKRNYLNYPHAATPTFASKHNFSIVTKYFVQPLKSQLGFTYSFSSGRPYSNPNNAGFNTMRTPNYADLSFNWSYLPVPSVIIYFSCTNLLGRDNIFGYEYSSNPDVNGVYHGSAIRQSAPRFFFLAVFLTLSKDKSTNQLPNL